MEFSKEYIMNIMSDKLHTNLHKKSIKDYKSRLQERMQRIYHEKTKIVYLTTNETGPEHQKNFFVDLIVNGKKVSSGVGATLEIKGFCKEGLYTGTLVLNYEHIINQNSFDAPSSNEAVMLPFVFEVEEPLSLSVKKDVFFGTYISPGVDATVVISPEGVNAKNIVAVGTKQPHGAVVEVEGVSNRSVVLNFGAEEIYLSNSQNEDAQPLKVNKFTAYPSNTVFLPDMGSSISAKQDVFIGATLNVPKNTPPGEYKGNVIITFLYNDN